MKIKKSKHTSYQIAYEPDLIPPLDLMRTEGIDVLEEWFRWGEEWSMLLRVYGKLQRDSAVLEIGCGLGRIAFPLRYLISREGFYEGFEIIIQKVEFLRANFQSVYPNFGFSWANIHNTYYNTSGIIPASEYEFPYPDEVFDLAFAASVFTHMLPDVTEHYFAETARVLKPGGRAVFSFFLLDNYVSGQERPLGFTSPNFDFEHKYKNYGKEFSIVVPDNPEQMTAYRLSLLKKYAKKVGLSIVDDQIPGIWSGSSKNWVGSQDIVILQKGK